jgi:hypothetical protein
MSAEFQVLHLRSSAGLYGAEYVILGLLPALAEGGIDARLLCLDNPRVATQALCAKAKELGVPVLVRDIKEDQALVDAGISRARALILATNDAMGNLEVALDARRMNPRIRVVMRMFDDQIALKVAGSMKVDAALNHTARRRTGRWRRCQPATSEIPGPAPTHTGPRRGRCAATGPAPGSFENGCRARSSGR